MGGQASSNEFFVMLGNENFISIVMICSGFFLLITASIGCTAAASKNEFLAFLVRQ